MFGLEGLKDLPAGLLSAGQKRKLALLRLFAAPARSGCSTSLRSRSTQRPSRYSTRRSPSIAQGGIAVVASHTSLKVKFARARAEAGDRPVKEVWALFRRDVVLALREGGTIGTALGFYLVVVAITPLGLGPDLNLLSRIAPGVLWVALLKAAAFRRPHLPQRL